jgi:hypothetical protein
VATIDFDINFLNFEDPDVLARLTGPDYKKYWKATYGVDYVTKLPGQLVVEDGVKIVKIDETPMANYCLKSEYR